MYGMRVSLIVGLLSVLFAIVVGIAFGLARGLCGGILDTVLMRIADVQLTFPSILTACWSMASSPPPAPHDARHSADLRHHLRHRLSLWPNFARTVRGSTLVERNKDYVMAARVIGVPSWKIMLSHVLPRHRPGHGDRYPQPRPRDHR